jgi:hypothetical protein
VAASSAIAVLLITTAAFVAARGDPHGGVAHVAIPLASESSSSTPSPVSQQPMADPASPSVAITPNSPTSLLAPGPSPSNAASSPELSPSPVFSSSSLSTQPPCSPERTARATPAPTPRPTPPPTTPPPISPGEIRFETSLGQDGEIAKAATQFGEGQRAVWIADFSEAPNASTIRLFIVQVLPDGREFEHWREDIALADPAERRLVGGAFEFVP